ncbi:M6 family metalloprotease domain-containing protein [Nonomuraea solani]|uniref:M6 family metalloprotease domain-containing protein n=1 Tax=Nonomuraea solani TaxID=1144553 RepID=A0A1H5ZT23_9ACTN|nr:M6 family metalloprotease domain-containing protein [Nonomuraea solani]SEG39144.1 M6 family metalloprotease domain-containing protein [Nonomuraea solani]
MTVPKKLLKGLLAALVLIPVSLMATPASAAPPADPEYPWRQNHWPQTQPWQRDAPPDGQALRSRPPGGIQPIDPQNWENPDHMTWADYKKPPGTQWNDPAVKGSKRTFKGALVLLDYPNQAFVVTQPKGSTIYANPSAEAHDVPRDQVAKFYQDFLNTPNDLNKGHTIHEYWMEDSGGRYGVDLTGFGPYTMPGKDHEYAMEPNFNGTEACPAGDSCDKDLRADGNAAWLAAVGPEVAAQFDFVFYLSAGQDESSTWQEFGMMKFPTKEDVTDEWGPPDPALPNWIETRYVEWSSWQAGSNFWPNARFGVDSVQAESSGMAVYAHELSHIMGIADNYNNPYSVPARRAYTGIWEMLSRGSFNGPGGPHSRWLIPPTSGASMGAQHMLRNKIKLEMVDEQNVLRLSREALDESGLVTAKVVARSVQPGKNELAGVNIAFDGPDKSSCQAADPLCDRGGYQNYTVEVVDRMGTDSFTPDAGVLLAKTKNEDRAPFEWVIDANPQDIGMTDYVMPDGTQVPITVGDYRQLSDALFHAGTDSGSEYEYVDEANRLHFYITDVHRNRKGELSYTVAIRSLDGAGAQKRGVKLLGTAGLPTGKNLSTCKFPLFNTGKAAPAQGQHPEDVSAYLNSDLYRLKAEVQGKGWTAQLPNALSSVAFGKQSLVSVNAVRGAGADRLARVKLTATSESDPSKTVTATCHVIGL